MHLSKALFGVLAAAVALQAQSTPDTTKWGKYIVTKPAPPPATPAQTNVPGNVNAQPKDMIKQITYVDSKVVPGAYYCEVSWITKAYPENVWVKEHTHKDMDEFFGFYGSDPSKPEDLGAEIEIVIAGEKHLLTKSCLVFVPKGVPHCPLTIKKLNRPVLMFTTGPNSEYKF